MMAVAQDATCQSITYRAARIVSNTGNSLDLALRAGVSDIDQIAAD